MSWNPTGWLNPVTNRTSAGSRTMRPIDMTRIKTNINLILTNTINSPMTYTWNGTNKRFVTVTQWSDIINYTKQLNHFGLTITGSSIWNNLNAIEKVALYCYYQKNSETGKKLSFALNGFKLGGTQF